MGRGTDLGNCLVELRGRLVLVVDGDVEAEGLEPLALFLRAGQADHAAALHVADAQACEQ